MPRQIPWQQPGYRSPSPANDEDKEVIDSASEGEDNHTEDYVLPEPAPGVRLEFEQWRQRWNTGVQARRKAAGKGKRKEPLPVQSPAQDDDGSASDSSDAFDPPPASKPPTHIRVSDLSFTQAPATLIQSKAASTTYEERIMVKALRCHAAMSYQVIAKKLNLTLRQVHAKGDSTNNSRPYQNITIWKVLLSTEGNPSARSAKHMNCLEDESVEVIPRQTCTVKGYLKASMRRVTPSS
ncbi:hypothetical protein VTH82DRAFT_5394 [Thermothelomyces myriococcoides]